MRPERRFKPGMDGGLTANVLVSPPLHLRTSEILSKQWGPPQPNIERLTRRKMVLLRKHNLTKDPVRSIQSFLKAEEEFFNRVWYDRHRLLPQMEH